MKMNRQPTQLELLERIVDDHIDRLFRYAFFRTGSRADAEDIVQEVLLKLFRSEKDLARVKDVEGYLLRSISNRCCDYHRRRRRTVPLDEAAPMAVTDDKALSEEDRQRIEALLSDLPPEQAEVIRLKTSEKLTFKRIAQLTDASEATVKSRFRYGIEKLRKLNR